MDNPSISKSLLPDSPVSRQFMAWLNAFNTPDPISLLSYHRKIFPYDVASSEMKSIDLEMALSQATGGFNIIDVLKSPGSDDYLTKSPIYVIVQERKRKMYARVSMRVDLQVDVNPVTKFDINPTITPIEYVPDNRKKEYERALRALSPALRRTIIRDSSTVIHNQYIFPDISEKMIHDLNAKAQDSAEYADYQNAELFAQRLTSDMQAVSRDMHIRVLIREPSPPSRGNQSDVKTLKVFDFVQKSNFGFGHTHIESIRGKKIGFLPIHSFVPSGPKYASDFTTVREAISNILTKVAHTDALIIDLRANRGGHPDTVAFILSYLLDNGPIHLIDLVDCKGNTKETSTTLAISDLPKSALRFGGSKPLFVLTSKSTISGGGEDMAYGLQAFGRANAIIGEDQTTAGAANPVLSPKFICEREVGEGLWWIGVPDMRPIQSVTGRNWEGVGVESDVVVRKGQGNAKDLGRRMALEALGVDDSVGA